MSGTEASERRVEAERWLAIADQDIAAVALCLNAPNPLMAVAAYHCQQAVEKIAKALLVAADLSFPKTHDLAALNAAAGPRYPALAATLAGLEPVSVWGFAYRYPPEEEADAPPSASELQRRLGEIAALRQSAAAAIRSQS